MICDVSKTENRYIYVYVFIKCVCVSVSVDSFCFSIVSIILLMSPSTRWKKSIGTYTPNGDDNSYSGAGETIVWPVKIYFISYRYTSDTLYVLYIHLYVRTHIQELLYWNKKTGKNPKEDAGRTSINHSLSAFEEKKKYMWYIYI